jgi:hypothetical protein
MVLATLEDRKHQTRRLHGLHEINERPGACRYDGQNIFGDYLFFNCDAAASGHDPPDCIRIVKCPYHVGDRLWVRESARLIAVDDGADYVTGIVPHKVRFRYEADGTESDWLPYPNRLAGMEVGHCVPNGCYHELARIFLEITEVRVQRVQEITEEDAIAEGCQPEYEWNSHSNDMEIVNAWENFERLWDSINGKRPGYSWHDNPWCSCITFKRV